MTDATAAVAWRARFRPFGELISVTGPKSLDARFPGQWFQFEAGLHANWHRNYDPTLRRTLEADPLGFPDGPNRYAYVGSSPLMDVDPEGLPAWGVILGGAELGMQLSQNGGNLSCVNWVNVGLSMLGGSALSALSKGVHFVKWGGSHSWSATSKWMNNRGIHTTGGTKDRHHWLFERNQGIGKHVLDSIKNQPWNINPISPKFNNWLSSRPAIAWLGAPNWAREAAGSAVLMGMRNGCGCR